VEHAGPELERTARRARRVVRGFRLVFYPGAVVAAVLLLAGRSDSDARTSFEGRTDQGHPFELELVHGRPASLFTRITATCSSREPRVVEWSMSAPMLSSRAGRQMTIADGGAHTYDGGDVGHRQLSLEAQIDPDRVTGHLSLSELVDDHTDGSNYRCESGTVDFSLRPEG
jgi:hypothetical protein